MSSRDLVASRPWGRGAVRRMATVALVLCMWLPGAASAEEAPLLRADLITHFSASALIAAGGYGLGGGLAAGLAKEAADLAGYGTADWRDLVADVVGAVTGAFIAWVIDRALATDRRRHRPALAAAAGRFDSRRGGASCSSRGRAHSADASPVSKSGLFVERAARCPSCGEGHLITYPDPKLYKAARRESDLHVLAYEWSVEGAEGIIPHHHFVWQCPDCLLDVAASRRRAMACEA